MYRDMNLSIRPASSVRMLALAPIRILFPANREMIGLPRRRTLVASLTLHSGCNHERLFQPHFTWLRRLGLLDDHVVWGQGRFAGVRARAKQ